MGTEETFYFKEPLFLKLYAGFIVAQLSVISFGI